MTDTSKPAEAAAPTTVDATGNASFEQVMRGYNGSMHNDELVDALAWARVCRRVAETTGNENHLSGTREAYAAIILGAAAKFEGLALHCGNITNEHVKLTQIICGAAHDLDAMLKGGEKGIAAILAMSSVNYSNLLLQKVVQVRDQNAQNGHYTTGEDLLAVFALFDPLVEYTRGLIRAPDNFYLTSTARIAAAGTAMQNCGFELHWILGSNWDKALWYTKRSLELLAIDPPADRPGPTEAPRRALTPSLQPAVNDMVKMIDALNSKHYRDSKRALTSINKCFESLFLAR